jgi:predicted nucleic acid-binding Zn ribbon protein
MMAKRQPLPLDAALQNLVEDLGISKRLHEYDVVTLWDKIVGEQISRVATAQRVEKGILFVAVSSAPWRAELTMRRNEIMGKINGTIGRHVVREIRFR